MHGLSVRNILIGEGIPKICVPIVAKNRREIQLQVDSVMKKCPDIIEFRADYFEDWKDGGLTDVLCDVRKAIGDTVLLFTLRTVKEGGQAEVLVEDYISLCNRVCESGLIDLIDVEAFFQEGILRAVIECAHANNVGVVASNHDFSATPDEEEIIRRLAYMDEQGADVLKIAVMPETSKDVLVLLGATQRYSGINQEKPIITMSMGGIGKISRLSGEVFGSAVTFASVERTSAPGQIPIDEIRAVLKIIHGDGITGIN